MAMASVSPSTRTHRTPTSPKFADDPQATQRFVIGKIDAGIAVLISDSVHLIEFPSLLLPAGVGPGSIVHIACTRDLPAEQQHARDFWALQREIAAAFGAREPQPPRLRVRTTTQTSVTLEWDPLDLAAADLLHLALYRNGHRLTTIPDPRTHTSTKLSGLALDADYAFHLVLHTSAGTYPSPVVRTRTHTLDNTTGLRVCFGHIQPPDLAAQAHRVLTDELGAPHGDPKIQIDTTHYIATSSASPDHPDGGPSSEYQKAIQLSIPIVTPEWLLACARAHKLVPIAPYYLGANPPAPTPASAPTPSASASARSTSAAPQPVSSTPPSPPLQPERETERPRRAEVIELQEDVEAPPEDAVVRDPPSGLPSATTTAAGPGIVVAEQEEEEEEEEVAAEEEEHVEKRGPEREEEKGMQEEKGEQEEEKEGAVDPTPSAAETEAAADESAVEPEPELELEPTPESARDEAGRNPAPAGESEGEADGQPEGEDERGQPVAAAGGP